MNKRIVTFMARLICVAVVIVLALGTGSSLAGPGEGGDAGGDGGGNAAELKARFWQSEEHAWELTPSIQASGQPRNLVAPAGTADIIDWSTIAFQSGRDENWEIYKARADGSEPVRLTNDPAADFRPNLNRDANRILFHSRRDGNSEIYSIDVDGSNLRRLTNTPPDDYYAVWSPDSSRIAYSHPVDNGRAIWVMNADGSASGPITYPNGDEDIFPTWSPDGSQIAFVRSQRGAGSLMIVDADGSNPRLVAANLRYLQGPAWSPDGRFIAVDYDYDNDQWNELVVITLDGGGRNLLYDPDRSFADAWMGAWSPDGKYIICSYIVYTVVDDNLYIANAYLVQGRYYEYNYLQDRRALPGSGIDMVPTWQGNDRLAPTSSMEALPGLSPSPFTVRWSGADAGISGLANFDLQVRDGVDAGWVPWLMDTTWTSAEWRGVGGHTYFFRVRARDRAGNEEPWPPDWDAGTTVEALPPQSQMLPVPPMMRYTGFVSWQGNDPGGSGIDHYEMQMREVGPPDSTWFSSYYGEGTVTQLTGNPGFTYDLRVRGIDRAQNVEAWPPEPGEARTTLYSWAIAGKVYDTLLRPMQGVMVSVNPDSFMPVRTDDNGRYHKYVANYATSYEVTWSRPDQGAITNVFPASDADAGFDIVVPPADDRVVQGGFEGAALASAWNKSGDGSRMQQIDSAHTGTGSFRLGDPSRLVSPVLVSAGSSPSIGLDSNGLLHVLWRRVRNHVNPDFQIQDIFYRNRAANGVWSGVLNLTQPLGLNNFREPMLAVTPGGVAHAAWIGEDTNVYPPVHYVFYTRRNLAGAWDQPEIIASTSSYYASHLGKVLVDASGNAHILWSEVRDENINIRYTWRRQVGQGGAAETVASMRYTSPFPLDMALSPTGKIFVAWLHPTDGVAIRERSLDGVWTDVGRPNMTADAAQFQMAAESTRLHFLWVGDQCGLCYGYFDEHGNWSAPERIDRSVSLLPFQVKMDEGGRLHAAWLKQPGIYYATLLPIGDWSPPELAAAVSTPQNDLVLTVHDRDGQYLLWTQLFEDDVRVFYSWRPLDGNWAHPQPIGTDGDSAGMLTSTSEQQAGVAFGWAADWWNESASKINVSWPRVDGQPAKTSTLEQRLFLPSSLSAPALTFAYRFDSGGPPGGNTLAVEVENSAGRRTVFSTSDPTPGWAYRSFDLSRWLGQPLTVRFRLDKAAGSTFPWVGLDEVSLGSATVPDVWTRGPVLMPQPGEVFTFTLPYGNRGEGSAADTELIAVLAPEIGVIATDPAPQPAASSATLRLSQVQAALERQEDGQVLAWDLGRLQSAQAGEVTISARIPVTVEHGARLHGDLIITTTTLESHRQDNEATLLVLAGNLPVYLPLMLQ